MTELIQEKSHTNVQNVVIVLKFPSFDVMIGLDSVELAMKFVDI